MSPLLEVKDLHVSFESQGETFKALRGVSFTLNRGERLGIVGESGCGKSVLVKSLTRLLPETTSSIDQGQAVYEGRNLLRCSEPELQRVRGKEISMIFQDPMTSLNPTLKIGTQILEGFLQHHPQTTGKEAHQRMIHLLTMVGISEPEKRAEEYPHTLSGGLRQRVMIALALAAEPKLLIADEPTTALDVTVQAQILSLMQEIQKEKSIILITHDLSVVAGFCDRVLVMYAGKIVEDAPVDQLFSNPQHPYTQRLLQSLPRLDLPPDTPLLPIPGSPPDLSKPLSGCAFCPRCPHAMNICQTEIPPHFLVQENHHSACFLHDPRRQQ
jgi:oligopeptide/dipeptide ABC transporter ATP-binding protein